MRLSLRWGAQLAKLPTPNAMPAAGRGGVCFVLSGIRGCLKIRNTNVRVYLLYRYLSKILYVLSMFLWSLSWRFTDLLLFLKGPLVFCTLSSQHTPPKLATAPGPSGVTDLVTVTSDQLVSASAVIMCPVSVTQSWLLHQVKCLKILGSAPLIKSLVCACLCRDQFD